MFKKTIILGILLSILLVLVIIKSQTSTPVTNLDNENSEYKTVEYKISQMKEDQYYGQSSDGTKIVFSAEIIDSSEKIQVGDVVICYFEKDNVGKGLVKVEKK
jgi:predicted Mrr-cat superfamily restriction endonuclease